MIWIDFMHVAQFEAKKKARVKRDPERVHWGHTQFWVNDDSEFGQLAAAYDPELGQSDTIICQACRKLTKFWFTFDTELSRGIRV